MKYKAPNSIHVDTRLDIMNECDCNSVSWTTRVKLVNGSILKEHYHNSNRYEAMIEAYKSAYKMNKTIIKQNKKGLK